MRANLFHHLLWKDGTGRPVLRDGRVESGRAVMLADGRFAELKEYVGGFTVIDVTDLDAATAWAARVSEATGLKIEVRPTPSFAG